MTFLVDEALSKMGSCLKGLNLRLGVEGAGQIIFLSEIPICKRDNIENGGTAIQLKLKSQFKVLCILC